MRRAVTIIELLTVVAIIAVLGALTYHLSAPTRQNGLQIQCMNQLSQIHKAAVMYGNDWVESDEVPGLPGYSYNVMNPNLLMPYLGEKDKSMFFCPCWPGKRPHPKLAGSSGHNVFPDPLPDDPPVVAELVRKNREEILEMGSSFPYVACLVHDQLFYLPREGGPTPGFRSPAFAIEARWDGGVQRVRSTRYLRRPFSIPLPKEEQ